MKPTRAILISEGTKSKFSCGPLNETLMYGVPGIVTRVPGECGTSIPGSCWHCPLSGGVTHSTKTLFPRISEFLLWLFGRRSRRLSTIPISLSRVIGCRYKRLFTCFSASSTSNRITSIGMAPLRGRPVLRSGPYPK